MTNPEQITSNKISERKNTEVPSQVQVKGEQEELSEAQIKQISTDLIATMISRAGSYADAELGGYYDAINRNENYKKLSNANKSKLLKYLIEQVAVQTDINKGYLLNTIATTIAALGKIDGNKPLNDKLGEETEAKKIQSYVDELKIKLQPSLEKEAGETDNHYWYKKEAVRKLDPGPATDVAREKYVSEEPTKNNKDKKQKKASQAKNDAKTGSKLGGITQNALNQKQNGNDQDLNLSQSNINTDNQQFEQTGVNLSGSEVTTQNALNQNQNGNDQGHGLPQSNTNTGNQQFEQTGVNLPGSEVTTQNALNQNQVEGKQGQESIVQNQSQVNKNQVQSQQNVNGNNYKPELTTNLNSVAVVATQNQGLNLSQSNINTDNQQKTGEPIMSSQGIEGQGSIVQNQPQENINEQVQVNNNQVQSQQNVNGNNQESRFVTAPNLVAAVTTQNALNQKQNGNDQGHGLPQSNTNTGNQQKTNKLLVERLIKMLDAAKTTDEAEATITSDNGYLALANSEKIGVLKLMAEECIVKRQDNAEQVSGVLFQKNTDAINTVTSRVEVPQVISRLRGVVNAVVALAQTAPSSMSASVKSVLSLVGSKISTFSVDAELGGVENGVKDLRAIQKKLLNEYNQYNPRHESQRDSKNTIKEEKEKFIQGEPELMGFIKAGKDMMGAQVLKKALNVNDDVHQKIINYLDALKKHDPRAKGYNKSFAENEINKAFSALFQMGKNSAPIAILIERMSKHKYPGFPPRMGKPGYTSSIEALHKELVTNNIFINGKYFHPGDSNLNDKKGVNKHIEKMKSSGKLVESNGLQSKYS